MFCVSSKRLMFKMNDGKVQSFKTSSEADAPTSTDQHNKKSSIKVGHIAREKQDLGSCFLNASAFFCSQYRSLFSCKLTLVSVCFLKFSS